MVYVLPQVVERRQEPVVRRIGVQLYDAVLVVPQDPVLVRPGEEELGILGSGGRRAGQHVHCPGIVPLHADPLVEHHGDGEHRLRAPQLGRFLVICERSRLVSGLEELVGEGKVAGPGIHLLLGLRRHELVEPHPVGVRLGAVQCGHYRVPAYRALLVAHVHAVLVPPGGLDRIGLDQVQAVLVAHPDLQEHLPVAGNGQGREPRLRLGKGLPHAQPVGEHVPDRKPGPGHALPGGLLVPAVRQLKVPGHDVAVIVLGTQRGLGLGVAEVGGVLKMVKVMGDVPRHVLALDVHLG